MQLVPASKLRFGDRVSLELGGPIYEIAGVTPDSWNGQEVLKVVGVVEIHVRYPSGRVVRSQERHEMYVLPEHSCFTVP